MPNIPRCQWIDLQRDYRQWYRTHHRQRQQRLAWHRPGSVWTVDHSQPPELVDGVDPQMLAVRDLASGLQLAWVPQCSAEASEASLVMEYLFKKFGPPLVLKSDNGSAFISDQWQSLLQRWHVTPLYSPVAYPQYNGSVEAGIGAIRSAPRCWPGPASLEHAGRKPTWIKRSSKPITCIAARATCNTRPSIVGKREARSHRMSARSSRKSWTKIARRYTISSRKVAKRRGQGGRRPCDLKERRLPRRSLSWDYYL